MRTWKQGRVGKFTLPDSEVLFIKCLRYPLAQFYERYNTETRVLESLLFEIFIQKSVLRYIEIIGQEPLTKEDKKNKERTDILDIEKIQKMYRRKQN